METIRPNPPTTNTLFTLPLYGGKGECSLVSYHGCDTDIVTAARKSYDGETRGPDADRKLLHYLYRHRHTSPFEQSSITFQITLPIFVMRQFVRHRTFRLNEFSGRYAKFDEDAFYLPGLWRKQDQKDRQSSILGVSPTSWHYNNNADALEAVNKAIDSYNKLLERGVAKELARIVLPVCMMTKIVVNCDIHNLMHFFRLRLSSHAQQEIRELASAMFQYFAALFPWCAEAYKRYTVNIIDNQEKP